MPRTNQPHFWEMDTEELRDWLAARRAALTEHKVFVQRYLDKRAHHQIHTETDERYQHFQELADDLLQFLNETLDEVSHYQQQHKEMPGSDPEADDLDDPDEHPFAVKRSPLI